jgi:hypothetical protein
MERIPAPDVLARYIAVMKEYMDKLRGRGLWSDAATVLHEIERIERAKKRGAESENNVMALARRPPSQ